MRFGLYLEQHAAFQDRADPAHVFVFPLEPVEAAVSLCQFRKRQIRERYFIA